MRTILLLTITSYVSAATWTVCKTGCDYPNANAAVQNSLTACGDTVQLKAGQGDGNGTNGTPAGWYSGGGGTAGVNNPVLLTKSCAATNPITITTDQAAKLPPGNVRITPAYGDGASPVVPTIYNPGAGMVLFAQPGNGGTPAGGYRIVGIQFCCFANFSDFIALGSRGQGTADSALNVTADIPLNITLDRVLIRTDPTQNTRKCITYDARNLVIQNSWVECAYDENSLDSEAINGNMGQGKLLNNYISGTTETFSFGGSAPPVSTPVKAQISTATFVQIVDNVEVAWNEVTKPGWLYKEKWTGATLMPKGKLIGPANGANSPTLKAQNTGVTSGAEPNWASLSVGQSLTDGGVTWLRTDVTDQAKNLFECKSCDVVTIHHNFFHLSWPQGQQGYAFTFTSSPSAGAGQRVTHIRLQNNYIRDIGSGVNTSGMDVANDINAMPSVMTNSGPWAITSSNNKLSITINGRAVAVTLTSGAARTDANLISDLTAAFASAGVGLACPDGVGAVIVRARALGDSSGCNGLNQNYPLGGFSLTVNSTTNNAAPTIGLAGKSASGCTNPRTDVWYGCGVFDSLAVTNNLFRNMNTGKYFSGIPYIFAIFQHELNTQYLHNTVDALFGANSINGADMSEAWLTDTQLFPPFRVFLRDNIIGWRGSFSGQGYVQQGGSLYDFSAINYMLCQPSLVDAATATPTDSQCPAGIFSHNVAPGANLFSSPVRNTSPFANNSGFNSYPSDNYPASVNFDAQTFRVLNPPGPSTDQGVPGVDPTAVPRVLGAKITVSDRAAVLQYLLSEPAAGSGFACVAYVTMKDSYFYTQPVAYAAADSAAIVPDMDPSLFVQPDWDGNDRFPQSAYQRSLVMGLNQPLTPSTKYYLRLSCPGAAWPEDATAATFTTRPAVSGSANIALRRTPAASVGAVASMRVTYGTAFSRSSGTISGGGTASVACSTGSACTVPVTAARGVPLYTRVEYLDSGAAVLRAEPVSAPLLF